MSLNQNQMKALEEMKDSRAISPELLSAFVEENGALNAFLCFALAHEELNICFRGNNDAIEIYYLNHLVWKLTPGRKGYYKVSFNFGHARGMLKEHDYFCDLKRYGFKLASDEKHICWEKECFTKKEINTEFWQCFKEIMDWYFDPRKGTPNIEKRWQHKFFRDFHKEEYLFHGLYVYDLEYHQKLPGKKALLKIFGTKTDDELKKMRVHSSVMKEDLKPLMNEPDFLGVEFDEENGETYLVFGEIKSLYKSCDKTSGIDSHLDKMKSYLNMDSLIKKRFADAEKILKQYWVIGDIKGQYSFDGLSEKLKVKNVLVLTNSKYYDEKTHSVVDWDNKGGAIAYFRENRTDIFKKAKSAQSEIWLVEDARCDDNTPITFENITRLTEADYDKVI